MIEFVNVSKAYGDNVGLSDVNIKIEEGEFVFLVGPSGAGKSTFIKLLLKEIEPDDGQIYFRGKDLTKMPARLIPSLRRNLGVVFQDFRLLPKKTVYENVAFAMEAVHQRRRLIKRQVPHILRLVGISEQAARYPHELSGGEAQRVAIARAIVNNPKVLIADEPTGNLDPEKSWEIMNLLEQINLRGTTVVMVTHEKDIVDRMGKRVIQIDDGEVVRDDQEGFYIKPQYIDDSDWMDDEASADIFSYDIDNSSYDMDDMDDTNSVSEDVHSYAGDTPDDLLSDDLLSDDLLQENYIAEAEDSGDADMLLDDENYPAWYEAESNSDTDYRAESEKLEDAYAAAFDDAKAEYESASDIIFEKTSTMTSEFDDNMNSTDASNIADTVDTADTADVSDAADTVDTAGTADASDAADTVNTAGTTDVSDTADNASAAVSEKYITTDIGLGDGTANIDSSKNQVKKRKFTKKKGDRK